MELIFIITYILQSIAISLGVGSSTIAIVNFFVAIADGSINSDERKMMGVVYIILRVAMVMILLTTSLMLLFDFQDGGVSWLSAHIVAQLTLVAVLFMNATLMTLRKMPSTIGPALQASTWYTLGIITSLASIGVVTYTPFQFLLGYITVFVLAVSIVNGMMSYLKSHRPPQPQQ